MHHLKERRDIPTLCKSLDQDEIDKQFLHRVECLLEKNACGTPLPPSLRYPGLLATGQKGGKTVSEALANGADEAGEAYFRIGPILPIVG